MQSLEVGWEAPLEQGRSTRCDQLGVKFKYMQMLSSSINLPMRTLGGLCHPLQSLQMLVKLRFSYSDVIYMLFLKKHVGFFFSSFFFLSPSWLCQTDQIPISYTDKLSHLVSCILKALCLLVALLQCGSLGSCHKPQANAS